MAMSAPAKKYLAHMQKADTWLASRDLVRHFKVSMALVSRTMRELRDKGLVTHFERLDDDGIVRMYFEPSKKSEEVKQEVKQEVKKKVKKEVKQKEVKQKEVKQEEVKKEEVVEEPVPKYTRLRDVYAEENYDHNMSLVARSFFDFLEKDKKINVLLFREAAKPKEEFKKELAQDDAQGVEEEIKKLEAGETKKVRKEKVKVSKTELRRLHIKNMVNTWFPTWAHIQSLPFTYPTGRLRSEKELLIAQQTGVL
jgi:hypothetical protein